MKKNYIYDSIYDSKRKLEMQEAIEYILEQNFGNTIPFETLGSILHLNLDDEKENKKFKSVMGRIKNFLIDYGYILKSVTNIGYYILKPKQISGYCYHTYIRKTQNLLEKSDRILIHVDTSELSEVRKQERNEVEKLNQDMYDNIGETIINSSYEKNKEMYNSLKD